ncbi:hypothetical protein PR202_ga10856 [Eleusine coracana subsp. coracana]|uniref:Uncharacterized protein n=1 Tax=Eleusine coracana subsp. coracana TaxID=191504 RepID=A0AAV5C7P6_ELECO|nr:hypothetical protein PR202_ga10856 [Eleusine coracana subsp. coracana]
MNPADSEKACRKKDKKEKRKKGKDAAENACVAAAAEEEASPRMEKKKQRKDEDAGEEKAGPRRKPTVSIAVAGSIIDNAQSLELATLVPQALTRALFLFQLAGQIARAVTVFRIDEVVVFDSNPAVENGGADEGEESGARFLVRILEYLETPQYLRRRLFPMHKNLKDCFHRLMHHTMCANMNGVTLEGDHSKGTLVDVGLNKNVLVEQILKPGKRVTVAMGTNRDLTAACARKVVPSFTPSEETGSYWGYKVRYATNLSGVFKNSPYKEGYDHIIGTSEHGETISSSELTLPSFRYVIHDPLGPP